VVNTSINAHVGTARSSVYAATRTAFLSLSKTLSSELLSRGIRVNAVSPGPVETPLYDKLGIPETYREPVHKDITVTVPFGRLGKSEEIAKAAVYLACDESA
jgi:NAD(P)-dependent dehydrogenase (short-subunit alcohol dehydrogenase family)